MRNTARMFSCHCSTGLARVKHTVSTSLSAVGSGFKALSDVQIVNVAASRGSEPGPDVSANTHRGNTKYDQKMREVISGRE